jgi:hypothetical protein
MKRLTTAERSHSEHLLDETVYLSAVGHGNFTPSVSPNTISCLLPHWPRILFSVGGEVVQNIGEGQGGRVNGSNVYR